MHIEWSCFLDTQEQGGACSLLAGYHYIFFLDSCQLGCLDLAWHIFKVMDDEPFKEKFRWIPPLMVEEVWAHVKEMPEVGAIGPSQSPRWNAVVLVRKKDRSLHICIDFCQLNAHTKKDSYPLPHIQEVMESMVGVRHFCCLDQKSGFWQAKMDEESKHLHHREPQILQVWTNAISALQCYNNLPMADAELLMRTESDILPDLSRKCDRFLEDRRGAFASSMSCVQLIFKHNLKLKCEFFKSETNYLGHHN